MTENSFFWEKASSFQCFENYLKSSFYFFSRLILDFIRHCILQYHSRRRRKKGHFCKTCVITQIFPPFLLNANFHVNYFSVPSLSFFEGVEWPTLWAEQKQLSNFFSCLRCFFLLLAAHTQDYISTRVTCVLPVSVVCVGRSCLRKRNLCIKGRLKCWNMFE